MGRFKTSRKQAENPNQGPVFPPGTFLVTLEGTRQSKIQDFHTSIPEPRVNRNGDTYQPRPQIADSSAELVSLRFGNAQPLDEATEDPGNLKLFQELVLQDGGVEIGQEIPESAETGWRLAQSNRVGANLALALDVAVEEDDDIFLPDNFAEMIREEQLNGQQVIVEVAHRRYHKRGQDRSEEPQGLEVQIKRFASPNGHAS